MASRSRLGHGARLRCAAARRRRGSRVGDVARVSPTGAAGVGRTTVEVRCVGAERRSGLDGGVDLVDRVQHAVAALEAHQRRSCCGTGSGANCAASPACAGGAPRSAGRRRRFAASVARRACAFNAPSSIGERPRRRAGARRRGAGRAPARRATTSRAASAGLTMLPAASRRCGIIIGSWRSLARSARGMSLLGLAGRQHDRIGPACVPAQAFGADVGRAPAAAQDAQAAVDRA